MKVGFHEMGSIKEGVGGSVKSWCHEGGSMKGGFCRRGCHEGSPFLVNKRVVFIVIIIFQRFCFQQPLV